MTLHSRDAGQAAGRARGRMVERLRGQGITDERVLAAMMQVPRHKLRRRGPAYSAYGRHRAPDRLPAGRFAAPRRRADDSRACAPDASWTTLESAPASGYQAAGCPSSPPRVTPWGGFAPARRRPRKPPAVAASQRRLNVPTGSLGLPRRPPATPSSARRAPRTFPSSRKTQRRPAAAHDAARAAIATREVERQGNVVRRAGTRPFASRPL